MKHMPILLIPSAGIPAFCHRERRLVLVFFFNDTATTEIYTLSLHDALPIYLRRKLNSDPTGALRGFDLSADEASALRTGDRSEEHTSELQSRFDHVCRR